MKKILLIVLALVLIPGLVAPYLIESYAFRRVE